MVQGACLKWVITTCKQASLFSIYLLFCPTEKFYVQFKIQFNGELKHFIQKKPPKSIQNIQIMYPYSEII